MVDTWISKQFKKKVNLFFSSSCMINFVEIVHHVYFLIILKASIISPVLSTE